MRNKPTTPRFIHLLGSAQRHLQQWMSLQQQHAANAAGHPLPTPVQAGALFVLAQADGRTMGEIARALDLEPPAVSGLVQRIEALGWVARQPCPQDGRTQRVWLSPAGQALLPTLRTVTQGIQARLCEGFTPEELATVARWLEHVRTLDTPQP
jgi:DNA-binding MarR family transcriptional regulator